MTSRTTPVPPPPAAREEFPGIRRILVPVDFSETVPALVHYAMEIVRGRGATVRLLHVVGPPASLVDRERGSALDPRVLRELTAESEIRLGRIAKDLRGLTLEVKAVSGHPAKEILREAAEWGADVIVIGTRGRTGVRRALLGSVAEKVVRGAPCPVLTVHRARLPAAGA